MNTFRSEIQYAAAMEALEVCKAEGDTILYQDRASDTAVSLWAIPGKVTRRLNAHGSAQEEETMRTFSIPRQENFPPDNGPSSGAQITYEGFVWTVSLLDDVSWTSDSVGACFTCTTTRHQLRRANA